MVGRLGFTLMEMLVVLIIIGICAGMVVPNFRTPFEHGYAVNAQNNLLAIYTAQQNYNNEKGTFCLSGNGICNSLTSINSNLSLNIQDNGKYVYTCGTDSSGFICTATGATITLTLTNAPVSLATGSSNPTCAPSTSSYCP